MPKPKSRWNFCSPWKQARGKGQSVSGATEGQRDVLLTPLSASGFGIVNHPTWFSSFSSSFPGTGQPQGCRAPSAGTELGWTNTCVSRIIFPTRDEKETKKSDFLPSFSVGNFRPSLGQPLSACTGSARPRDRRQDPPPPFRTLGLGLGGDFSLSRRQHFPHSSVSVTKPS